MCGEMVAGFSVIFRNANTIYGKALAVKGWWLRVFTVRTVSNDVMQRVTLQHSLYI